MENNKAIATTILQQIKAADRWALGSWGSREMVALDRGVQFRVSGSKLRGKIRIVLNGMDTYDLTSYRLRNHDAVVVQEFTDIYCDQLVAILDSMIEKRHLS